MDRSKKITLIAETYTTDDLGQRVPTETTTDVYCQVQSVTATEWFSAGQSGIKPTYKFSIYNFEYSGQKIVKYNNVRYAVYRTYEAKNDIMELYVEEKVGI